MPELQTFRDTIRKLSPPWLRRGINEKILYTLGTHIDAMGDAVTAAIKVRFPGLYSDESLPLIGNERRIRRGRLEPAANYAVRLRRWLSDHQRRGGPYALLAQLFAYYSPSNFEIQLIYNSGRRFTMDTSGNVVRDDIVWTPDSLAGTHWARWWLFYFTDQFGSPTAEEIEDLKLVPREWNNAHCLGYIVLFPSDVELWDFPLDHVWDESGTWDTPAGTGISIPVDD